MDEDCAVKILGAPDAQVVQTKEIDMKQPLLVCCFPSAGVVGTIAAQEMIQQFETLGENQMRIAKNIDSQEVSNSVLNTKRFIQDRLTTGGY